MNSIVTLISSKYNIWKIKIIHFIVKHIILIFIAHITFF
jgi:hypothetical protein